MSSDALGSRPDVVVDEFVHPADHEGWLRCRVLAFLHSDYFDDVQPTKVDLAAAVQLVARASDGTIVGIADYTVDDAEACLEMLAVHPDHQRRGVAAELMSEGERRLRALGVAVVTVWTRDSPPSLAVYGATGFEVVERYLHVYATDDDATDVDDGLITAVRSAGHLRVVKLFGHAELQQEAELRSLYRRVYVCHGLRKSLVS